MNPHPLIIKTRGKITECTHYGDIAVVNTKGQLVYSKGDPYLTTYIRSAAKPIQALNVLLSGAADAFDFTPGELAIMCASHYGETFHIKTIESILGKIGLTNQNLLCGTVTSLNPKYALELAWNNVELNPMFSDCSGKQAGMLAVCKHKGYDINTYLHPSHPCQIEILGILSNICDIPKEDISIGVDGCSAPVHAMPLYNMALGYARFCNNHVLDDEFINPTGKIFHSMNQHPEMVSGTNGFCTNLIDKTNGKLIGKVGAEGIYCIGAKDRDIGIAIKIRDGSMDVLPPIAIKMLREFDILTKKELDSLAHFEQMNNINDLKKVVGVIKTAF